MKLAGAVVVVTGAASGIGRALCVAAQRRGAAAVVATDIDLAGAEETAEAVGGTAFACDVTRESDITRVVAETESRFGPIGLYCSNAGVAVFDPDQANPASAADDVWARCWAVNVMAHVRAARVLGPRMAAHGGGHFLLTVSAAGLLSQLGSATYATTKHAAVGFGEILAITLRDQGVGVSILCPQAVDTPLLHGLPGGGAQAVDGVLSADAVAEAGLAGVEAGQFVILPHPQVAGYMRRKAEDYDRWIGGMAKLRRRMAEG